MTIHDKLANSHPSLQRGMVWCRTCGRSQRVDPAGALRNGWPKCCGYTMTVDSPEERQTKNKMFKVGDKVKWESASNGTRKEKVGEVVEVVKAKAYPDFRALNKKHNSRDAYGGGRWRGHESYVVLVPHTGKGKGTLYWPLVSALTSA